MPSDSKSVRSVKSQQSFGVGEDFAMTSDEESYNKGKRTFKHRTKVVTTHPREHDDDRSLDESLLDHEHPEHRDEDDQDSDFRPSSLLMSKTNEDMDTPDAVEDNDDDDGSVPTEASDTPSRSKILGRIEDRAIKRFDADTMHMSHILEYLGNAMEGIQSFNEKNVYQESMYWKERAVDAEEKNTELMAEIDNLQRQCKTWESRLRRSEKRVEKLMKEQESRPNRPGLGYRGMSSVGNSIAADKLDPEEKVKGNNTAPVVEAVKSEEPTEGPRSGLKTLIHGRSFRQKWDRMKLAGIEKAPPPIEESPSTIAAKKYVEQYLEETGNKGAKIDAKDSMSEISFDQKRRLARRNSRSSSVSRRKGGKVKSVPTNDGTSSWQEMLSV